MKKKFFCGQWFPNYKCRFSFCCRMNFLGSFPSAPATILGSTSSFLQGVLSAPPASLKTVLVFCQERRWKQREVGSKLVALSFLKLTCSVNPAVLFILLLVSFWFVK